MPTHQQLLIGIEEAVEHQRDQHEHVPKDLSRLHRSKLTVSLELLLALMNPLAPTMTNPIIAHPHPATCLRSITIPKRTLEKMAVVTMLAPLNIR